MFDKAAIHSEAIIFAGDLDHRIDLLMHVNAKDIAQDRLVGAYATARFFAAEDEKLNLAVSHYSYAPEHTLLAQICHDDMVLYSADQIREATAVQMNALVKSNSQSIAHMIENPEAAHSMFQNIAENSMCFINLSRLMRTDAPHLSRLVS